MQKRLLIVGRTGQLATELLRRPLAGFDTTALDRDALPLGDALAAEAAFVAFAPDVVINAAAYTAVDKAESEPERAFLANQHGPNVLALLCAASGAALVHVSTDYVFDGAKATPYVETDLKAPASVYGCSKSAGEDAILASGARAAIVRTSWVFGASGANFVKTMLRLAQTRPEISVVSDQWGRPTWAQDLAAACYITACALAADNADARGIFHFAGADDATWADLAEAVFSEAARRGHPAAKVIRIPTSQYPVPAPRPANSRLDTKKIERVLGVRPRPWREAVSKCLDEIWPI
jgi:dTDP-4-dehydrorhamnose reductase